MPPEQPGVRAESGARPGPFAGIPPSAPARRPYEFPSTAPTARLAPPRPIDTRPEPEPVGRSEEERGNRLFVGRDISLTGQITSCASLHVEGRVQATLSESHKLEIGESGQFIGTADVQEGDISGVFDGELTVNRLVIRRKGRVTGRIRYGTLQVEEGGRLLGDIQEIGTASDSAATTPPVPANTPVEGAAS